MRLKPHHLYLVLCLLGLALPYSQFIPWVLPLVGTLVVGVSFGLPLFLYLRHAAQTKS